ncbi:hypothetical protein AB4Z46_02715 [Variovorax sp. M-6]
MSPSASLRVQRPTATIPPRAMIAAVRARRVSVLLPDLQPAADS